MAPSANGLELGGVGEGLGAPVPAGGVHQAVDAVDDDHPPTWRLLEAAHRASPVGGSGDRGSGVEGH